MKTKSIESINSEELEIVKLANISHIINDMISNRNNPIYRLIGSRQTTRGKGNC